MRWTALQMEEQNTIQNMLDMHGKNVLFTGGSGGIGRASALAELGANVILTGTEQSKERLDSYCTYISGRYRVKTLGVTGDVSREEDVKELFRQIREQFGDLHMAFSNAGFFPRQDLADTPVEDFAHTLAVDVTGTLLVCWEAANLMMEKKHGGALILNSSMTGHIVNRREDGSRYHVAYPAPRGLFFSSPKP